MKEDSEMQTISDTIEQCIQIIISPTTESLVDALYVGGTFHPEDRIAQSDVDVIGIVKDSFPETMESHINTALHHRIPDVPCKLRVLYRSELNGGKQRGFVTRLLPVRLFIRRLPLFPIIWGTAIPIDETIGAYSYAEEASVQVAILRRYLAHQYDGEHPIPFEWIPKAVLYLAAVELVLEGTADYSLSFAAIQRHLSHQPDHIGHASLAIRQSNYALGEPEKALYLERVASHLDWVEARYAGSTEPRCTNPSSDQRMNREMNRGQETL